MLIFNSFSEIIEFKNKHKKNSFKFNPPDLRSDNLIDYNDLDRLFEVILQIPYSSNADWIIYFIPPYQNNVDKKNILMVLDLDKVWGKLENLNLYLKASNLISGKNILGAHETDISMAYKEEIFKKLIDLSGRKVPLEWHQKRRAIRFGKNLALIGRWGQNGIRRYLPYLYLIGPILKGQDRYGFSYGIEMEARRNLSDAEKVKKLLSNDRSKEIFSMVMQGKANLSWEHFHKNMYSSPQYGKYLKWSPSSVVINGGVFTGAEIPLFTSHNPKKIYHIDPLGDVELNDYTRKFIRSNHFKTEHIFAKEFLSDKDDEKVFFSKGSQASVNPEGEHSVNGISLKGFYRKYGISKASIHKYDLEGAEALIFNELIEIMQNERSQLALSIYHRPNEYTEFPLALMENLTDYSFYIEHYSYEKHETILYCIPKEIERQ